MNARDRTEKGLASFQKVRLLYTMKGHEWWAGKITVHYIKDLLNENKAYFLHT